MGCVTPDRRRNTESLSACRDSKGPPLPEGEVPSSPVVLAMRDEREFEIMRKMNKLFAQFQICIQPNQKGLMKVAMQMSSVAEQFITAYKKQSRVRQKPESIEQLIRFQELQLKSAQRSYFESASQQIWKSCYDKLLYAQKKVFQKNIELSSQFPFQRDSSSKSFEELFHQLQSESIQLGSQFPFQRDSSKSFEELFQQLQSDIPTNQLIIKQRLSNTSRRNSLKKQILQIIKRWVQEGKFTNGEDMKSYQTILSNIKRQMLSDRTKQINDKELRPFAQFTLHLIWKKTQIDLFDSWKQKYYLYVKEQCGYQGNFANISLTKLIEDRQKARMLQRIKINSSKPNEKLRAEGMKAFSKVQLPNARDINIENQDIRDEGVQALCSNNSFQKLEQIELNDNKISVEGVAHLVNNKWSKQVTYKLDTVKTKDNGYAFKVGQGIKSIKKILDESNAQINYEEISKIESSDKPKLFHTLDLLMKTPLEGKYKDLVSQSQELQNKYKEVHQQNVTNQTKSLESVMMTLKEVLGQNAEVLLSKKSNARSQVTCTLALCGLGQNRIKFRHRIPNGRWKFEDLEDNNANLVKFQEWYKEHLAAEYGAQKEDIVLHRVNKGSVWTCASVNPDNFLIKNSNFSNAKNISVTPFFESFNLSPEDFDSKGNFTFPEKSQTDLQYRAGIPYFQPVYAIRFGFNIRKKYDQGNDDWISMNGISGEWAVAFHGINDPAKTQPSNNMTAFQSIMGGLEKGEMLRKGYRQLYSDYKATNSGQRVGDGIYCSPFFTTCLLHFTNQCKRNNLGFRVILQCRIKPEALKCTNQDDYWVINESKNIRPYGVILVTQQQYDTISRLSSGLYSKSCKYQAWKDQYKQFRQKHGLSLW